MRNRRLVISLFVGLVLTGCGRNRFEFIDIAASERTLQSLEEGFRAAADTVPGARADYLLSQGLPVADVLIYAGEVGDTLFSLPDIPYGYNYNYISTDMLLDSLCIKHGRLYTAGGLNARMLYLQDERMSLRLLNKISVLAGQGALIGGVRPTFCLDEADEQVFQRMVEKIWLEGNVMSGKTIKSILRAAGVKPDMKTKVDSLLFDHRHLAHADIYHIRNAGSHTGKSKIKFRVVGRQPLLWNPDTGEISPVSYKLKKRHTRVTMNLVPDDETFVVFCSFADRKKLKVK